MPVVPGLELGPGDGFLAAATKKMTSNSTSAAMAPPTIQRLLSSFSGASGAGALAAAAAAEPGTAFLTALPGRVAGAGVSFSPVADATPA